MSMITDNDRGAIFAEEALVVDVQIFLNALMEQKGVSRADLAKAMGVSRARVSQMFSDDCTNLTVRSVARAAFALGETVELDCGHFQRVREGKAHRAVKQSNNVRPLWQQMDEDETVHCHEDDRLNSFVAHGIAA